MPAEDGGEVLAGAKAQLVGDPHDVIGALGQELAGFLDAAVEQVIVQRVPGLRLETRAQPSRAQPEAAGDAIQVDLALVDPVLEPCERASDAPGDERVWLENLAVSVMVAEDGYEQRVQDGSGHRQREYRRAQPMLRQQPFEELLHLG